MLKIVNQTVPEALARLGYNEVECREILANPLEIITLAG
jgi:hypothetical protein